MSDKENQSRFQSRRVIWQLCKFISTHAPNTNTVVLHKLPSSSQKMQQIWSSQYVCNDQKYLTVDEAVQRRSKSGSKTVQQIGSPARCWLTYASSLSLTPTMIRSRRKSFPNPHKYIVSRAILESSTIILSLRLTLHAHNLISRKTHHLEMQSP
jgi:hypothetical protein